MCTGDRKRAGLEGGNRTRQAEVYPDGLCQENHKRAEETHGGGRTHVQWAHRISVRSGEGMAPQDEEEKNDFKEQLYYLAIPDADKRAKYAKKIFEDIFEFNAPEKEEVK